MQEPFPPNCEKSCSTREVKNEEVLPEGNPSVSTTSVPLLGFPLCNACHLCAGLLVVAAIIALFNRLGPYSGMPDRPFSILVIGALPTILMTISGIIVMGVVLRSLGVVKWFILAFGLAVSSQILGITDEIQFLKTIPVLGAQGAFHGEVRAILEIGAYLVFLLSLYRALFSLRELGESSQRQAHHLQSEIELRAKAQEELLKERNEVQWLATKLTSLTDLGRILTDSETVNDLCIGAVLACQSYLGVDRLSIWLSEDGGEHFSGTFGIDEDGNLCDERGKTYELKPMQDTEKMIIRRSSPVTVIRNGSVQSAQEEVIGIADQAVVALWSGDVLIGELRADMLISGNPMTQPVIQLLGVFGEKLGYLLARKKLEESLRQAQRIEHRLLNGFSDLHQVTMELAEAETVDALCRYAVEVCKERFGFHRVEIWLSDVESGALRGSFRIDEDGKVYDICDQTFDPSSLVQLSEEGTSSLNSSVSIFPMASGFQPLSQNGEDGIYRNVLPLSVKGKTLGMMMMDLLYSRETWTQADVDISLVLAETISHLLNSRLQEDQRRKMAAQMTQMQKFESLGILAGGIAHDFNNILGAIVGFTELGLVDLPEESPVREMQEQVLRAARRATELVRQILAFSRKSIEKPGEMILPHLVVKEVAKLLRATIPSTIRIRTDIKECGAVAAQATHIHQIVMNLCTNAYHAMKTQGELLEVTLKSTAIGHDNNDLGIPPGRYVHLTVRDEGEGMDAETLGKACEPFFTTKDPGKGTGLGLSTVHGIAASLGGTLTLSSSPGKGTVVQVYLPECSQSKGVETKPVSVESKVQAARRILVVDDEVDIVRVFQGFLERIGQRVTGTTSSVEALDMIRTQPGFFDLLITDQTMPQMTGLRLTQSVHEIRPDLPVVLITGDPEKPVDIERARSMNILAILSKPVSRAALIECLNEVLPLVSAQGPDPSHQ